MPRKRDIGGIRLSINREQAQKLRRISILRNEQPEAIAAHAIALYCEMLAARYDARSAQKKEGRKAREKSANAQ